MELASIYLDETKLDENNKFTINFLSEETDFNVFFNKNTICYITNLDLNLVLDDYETVVNETENKTNENITYHKKVIELSKLSNELITKKFNNTKFNEVKLVNQYPTDITNLSHKLILTDDIIDIASYKYNFLDTNKNEIKECKIYDQYQHLKVGMQFQFNKISTYTIRLVKDALTKKLEYDGEKLKINFWSRFINSIVTYNGNKLLIKTPLYSDIYEIFKQKNISISKLDLFQQYYKCEIDNHEVICHENIYKDLTEDQKKDVVFIVLNNKKIRIKKDRNFWLVPYNVRGDIKGSFANKVTSYGLRTLSQTALNTLKNIDPAFPFTKLNRFRTLPYEITVDILNNDVQFFTRYYNPFYFMDTDVTTHRDFFRSIVGITYRNQTDLLSENQQTNLKKILSKEVDEIKQLVEKEEIIINSLKKESNLVQKQFYLYDNSNIIKPTLLTELNQEINLYGKMELNTVNVDKISKLIKTEDSLKFQVSKNIFKEELDFEIQSIIKKEHIKTTDNKAHNITIVMIPQITKRYTLIDSIKIVGFSSVSERLNPVYIVIENNDIINKLRNKNYKFRLTVNSVLISSDIKDENQVIHLNATSLTDARFSLINNKLLKSLGQINLNEIENFDLLKVKKAWLNCVLSDSKKVPYGSKHFSYSFITNKLINILNFEIEFLNRKGERLEWEANEKRLPYITFTIDVLK